MTGKAPSRLAPRTVAVLALLLTLVGAPPSRAADDAGSVRIGPVRVEAPASSRGERVRVSVSIGQRRLWRSPAAVVPVAPWTVSLRAFTARRLPLVFQVLGEDPATATPSPSSPAHRVRRSGSVREQDAALTSGIEDLVGDYGAGTLDDPGEPFEPARVPAASPTRRPGPPPAPTRCTARLSWPPADGEHRLACGPFTVVVRTVWLGK